MDTVTHALAPVVMARLAWGHPDWIGKYGFWAIGIAGALPDLINPHLSLESRMNSWSHGLPFWATFTVVLLLCSRKLKVPHGHRLAALMAFAYIFHMFCDALSGGIDWLRPFSSWIWGTYYVGPEWWVPIDIVLVITAYLLFRVFPVKRKHANSEEAPVTPP